LLGKSCWSNHIRILHLKTHSVQLMKSLMSEKTSATLTLFCLMSWLPSAQAVVVNFQTVPLTVNSNSIEFSVDGISATATAYHTEFPDGTTATNITYGPFGTQNNAISCCNFPWFGRVTSVNTGEVLNGLGMYANQALGQTDDDAGGGLIQPGFDNGPTSGMESMQFALFEFAAPVNLSQVIVDDVSNFGRSIWVAGGNTAPDFSGDFLSAFSGYTFINSEDDATDGFFTHNIGPLNNVSYIAIGTPPRIGDLGPILDGGNDQFYIEGLNITQVPVPAAVWLFGSGLLGLIGIARRKKTI